MNRPNILYNHSDDTGRYIQPYGRALPTANLPRLAAEGVLFRQAFCAAPTCSPLHAVLLAGQCAHVEQINEAVFAAVNFHFSFEPMRAVRAARWKYIRRFDGRSRPVLIHCDGSPGREYWLQQGWREQPVVPEQLYDLCFDPVESNNVIDDPAHTGVLQALRERLDRWMQETNDPLLQGVNLRDC